MDKQKRKFIELDGLYYEIISKEVGFDMVSVTADNYLAIIAESDLLGVNNTSNENVLQTAINNTSSKLQKSVETKLNDLVYKLIGFSDSWGKWEIDHCNGRMSDVASFISTKVRNQIVEELDKGINFISDKDKVELQIAMRKEFLSLYKDSLKRTMQREAQQLADKHADEIIKEMVENQLKDKASSIIEAVLTNKKT